MKWTKPIVVLVLIAGLSGCATPEAAVISRTKLATISQMELEQAARESDAKDAVIMSYKTAELMAEKRQKYESEMLKAATPEEGAAIGFAYAQGVEATKANIAAEAKRLSLTGTKIRVNANVPPALNEMADLENKSVSAWQDFWLDEALPIAVEGVRNVQIALEEKAAAEKARLEAEAAKAAAEEAAAAKEEEHAHEPEPDPAPVVTPPVATPPATTTPTGS